MRDTAPKPASDVRDALLLREDPAVGLAPDASDPSGHAHGIDDLGVALAGAGHGAARLQGAHELRLVRRVRTSVSRVRQTRTTAPSSAVMPIQKWKAKQMVR